MSRIMDEGRASVPHCIMAERVRTTSIDKGPAVARSSTAGNVQAAPPTHTNVRPAPAGSRGKKRKRDAASINQASDGRLLGPRSLSTRPNGEPVRKRADGSPKESQSKRKTHPPSNASSTEHKGPPGTLRRRRDALLPFRKALPIWPHSQRIRDSLRGPKDVLLLVGETGSGKSTQVPQFLLSEPWCRKCIAITQPRRVAAISLARRVAEEMGTPLGSSSPASRVGYSVRFDNSTSPSTRIKFLTEGMLLQEMLRDPWLGRYSAVIVDEVHERSVNVDLILGFLRNLVTGDRSGRRGAPFKVVVMSATADTESLSRFFHDGYRPVAVPDGQVTNGADSADGEEDLESSWSGISTSEDETAPRITQSNAKTMANIPSAKQPDAIPTGNTHRADGRAAEETTSGPVSTCYIEGRQHPVETIYLPEPTQDFVEAALKAIFRIHCQEPLPGDMLVFLTGQDTVEALENLVREYALGLGPEVPKLQPLPLFAALPQAVQQRVFTPAPPNTRKVILSTNIAETSVTVPGVRFVVDCGKAKQKHFRSRLGLDSLLVKSISQSAATQRKGRAGREAPGKCYRLYAKKDYEALEKCTAPEILRCDLSSALLSMKARGIDDVIGFPFLDRPPRDALEKALLQLLQLGALAETGEISDIGRKMARFPLSPSLARCLVEAANRGPECVLDVIDVIACLSVENIFLQLVSEEQKDAAEDARKALMRREGDHLTMLVAVRAYAAENVDRKLWAEKHFVSHRAMQNVMAVRMQLRAHCVELELLPSDACLLTDCAISEPRAEQVLRSLLCGFPTNTAMLGRDRAYRTCLSHQEVAIHPSSVLFGKKVEAILFTEFVYTTRPFARGVSAVVLPWIGEMLGTGG